MSGIRERVHYYQERIARFRPDAPCRLMAVSKGQSREAIDAAIDAGVCLFGENRVQEAVSKWTKRCPNIELHMIGHLQSNKVKCAIQTFSAVDSIDSLALADALNRRLEVPLSVMLEVNVGAEETKSGLRPDLVRQYLTDVGRFPRLQFDGILAVLPQAKDSSHGERKRIRNLMQETAELWRICQSDRWPWAPLSELSMGMSGDYEWALEAGATVIRIGQGIFGPRD